MNMPGQQCVSQVIWNMGSVLLAFDSLHQNPLLTTQFCSFRQIHVSA